MAKRRCPRCQGHGTVWKAGAPFGVANCQKCKGKGCVYERKGGKG